MVCFSSLSTKYIPGQNDNKKSSERHAKLSIPPPPPPRFPRASKNKQQTTKLKETKTKLANKKKKPHPCLKWYRCKDNKENMVKAYFSIPTLFHKGRAKRRLQKAYLISDTRHLPQSRRPKRGRRNVW